MNSKNIKTWLKCAGIRTVKTMAETFVAMVSTAVVIAEVDWKYVASATILSGILTVATCIKGLPEVKVNEDITAK